MSDWTTARWADGPLLVRWLEERGVVAYGREGDALRGLLRKWRLGTSPLFATVDRVLVQFGLHPSEVPDEVWRGSTECECGRPARYGDGRCTTCYGRSAAQSSPRPFHQRKEQHVVSPG